jgi:hypothetical protein
VQLNPNYTVGEAVKFFQDEIKKQPTGLNYRWGGTARDCRLEDALVLRRTNDAPVTLTRQGCCG